MDNQQRQAASWKPAAVPPDELAALDELVQRVAPYDVARAAGISRRELAGPLWRRTSRGRYIWSSRPAGAADVRIHAAAALLPPDGAVGGWAAAWLQRVSALDGAAPWGAPYDVLLCVPPPRKLLRRPGVEVLRAPLLPEDIRTVAGIPVTEPRRTCFDLIRRGLLEDAVVAVDAMLATGTVSLEEMRAYVAARPRWDGVPQARQALDLADARAESAMETRFRLLWTSDGLPRPRCNVPLYDLQGDFLGRSDLLDDEAAVLGEFDGEHHADRRQRSLDARREELLERHGLIVVKATTHDLYGDRAALLRRIHAAVRAGRGRDRSRDRWTTHPLPEWLRWASEEGA